MGKSYLLVLEQDQLGNEGLIEVEQKEHLNCYMMTEVNSLVNFGVELFFKLRQGDSFTACGESQIKAVILGKMAIKTEENLICEQGNQCHGLNRCSR